MTEPSEPLLPYDLSEGASLLVPRSRPLRNALDEPRPPRWRRVIDGLRWRLKVWWRRW